MSFAPRKGVTPRRGVIRVGTTARAPNTARAASAARPARKKAPESASRRQPIEGGVSARAISAARPRRASVPKKGVPAPTNTTVHATGVRGKALSGGRPSALRTGKGPSQKALQRRSGEAAQKRMEVNLVDRKEREHAKAVARRAADEEAKRLEKQSTQEEEARLQRVRNQNLWRETKKNCDIQRRAQQHWAGSGVTLPPVDRATGPSAAGRQMTEEQQLAHAIHQSFMEAQEISRVPADDEEAEQWAIAESLRQCGAAPAHEPIPGWAAADAYEEPEAPKSPAQRILADRANTSAVASNYDIFRKREQKPTQILPVPLRTVEQQLREDQATEFDQALQEDRRREAATEAAIEHELAEMRAKRDAEQAAVMEAAAVKSIVEMKRSRLTSEPAEHKGEGVVELQVRLPDGDALRRRFRASAAVQACFPHLTLLSIGFICQCSVIELSARDCEWQRHTCIGLVDIARDIGCFLSCSCVQALYDFVDLEINRDRQAADGYELECTYPRAILQNETVALEACGMTCGRYMLALVDKECETPCSPK